MLLLVYIFLNAKKKKNYFRLRRQETAMGGRGMKGEKVWKGNLNIQSLVKMI